MNRIAVVFILTCYFLSCGKKSETSTDVLPPDKMHKILWDVLRADEMANYRNHNDTLHGNLFNRKELYQQVFTQHGTTADRFRKSLNFYQARPLLMKKILDSLQKQATAASAGPEPAAVQ